MKPILNLDLGTSSARALLWTETLEEVREARIQTAYAMDTTGDGGVSLDMERLRGIIEDVLDKAHAYLKTKNIEVGAVGVSSFWHSSVGVTEDGKKPATPLYAWADTRPAPYALKLGSLYEIEAVHQRTGCMPHPSYYPARLLWLQETQADLYGTVTHWVSPFDYLFGRWFGWNTPRTSVSMASGTGLMDQKTLKWDPEVLAALHLNEAQLPEIMAEGQSGSSQLTSEYARRWPRLASVPFHPAVGDGACGNIGSSGTDPTRFCINLGTSGAMRAVCKDDDIKVVPAGLWRYRVDANRPLLGGAFSDGGNVYAWLSRTFKLPDWEELERELETMEPATHGLTFLPFLAGERSPNWNPNAKAALVGMNLDTTPIEIAQAVMEAVAVRFTTVYRPLKQTFPQVKEIVASGGALGKSPAWAQMFADALGEPIHLMEEAEATSRGAALLAMEGAGLLDTLNQFPARLGKVYTPNPNATEVYRALREAQESLYTKILIQKSQAEKTIDTLKRQKDETEA